MGLSVLILAEDEDMIDISKADELLDAMDADMELPGQDTLGDNLNVLVEGALALEEIRNSIVALGIDYDTAKKANGIIAGMRIPGLGMESTETYRSFGVGHAFTAHRSIEGLHFALESIQETIKNAYSSVLKRVVAIYTAFVKWVKDRLGKNTEQSLKPSDKSKSLITRQGLNSLIALMEGLGDDPDMVAGEVARMAGGEISQFTTGLREEFNRLSERMSNFFEKISANRASARIASGDVSVAQLLKEEADQAVSGAVRRASAVAQELLKARDAGQLMVATEKAATITKELEEIASVSFDTNQSEFDGTEKGVKLSTIVKNLTKAVRDLDSSNVPALITRLTADMDGVLRSAQETSQKDIEEMMPADATDEQRAKATSACIALYGRIAGLGKTVSAMWAERINSIRSVNKILEGIYDNVEAFQAAIERLAAPLQAEQKEALAKALLSKGVAIES